MYIEGVTVSLLCTGCCGHCITYECMWYQGSCPIFCLTRGVTCVTVCKERQGKYHIFWTIRCILLPSRSLDASSILVHLSAPQNAVITFPLTLYVMQVGQL